MRCGPVVCSSTRNSTTRSSYLVRCAKQIFNQLHDYCTGVHNHQLPANSGFYRRDHTLQSQVHISEFKANTPFKWQNVKTLPKKKYQRFVTNEFARSTIFELIWSVQLPVGLTADGRDNWLDAFQVRILIPPVQSYREPRIGYWFSNHALRRRV